MTGELAAGRIPDLRLEQEPATFETLRAVADRYLETRIDATSNTLKTYRQAFAHLGALGDLSPNSVKLADVQAWASALPLAPASIRKYLDALRQALDFAEIEPNPARSPRLRLPRSDAEEIDPPTRRHVEALLETVSPRYRRAIEFLDETGLRIGELQALLWGDIDFTEQRLRVARGRTKGRTAGRRWVPLPHPLVRRLAALVPLEDRQLEEQVFPGLSDDGLRNAMLRACKLAGIPAYTPHDLRHRYISILVRAGVDPRTVASVVGHSKASMTLDVYSHVLIDEAPDVLRARRAVVERRTGDVPVTYGGDSQNAESPADAGLSVGMEDTGIEPVTFALPARRSPS